MAIAPTCLKGESGVESGWFVQFITAGHRSACAVIKMETRQVPGKQGKGVTYTEGCYVRVVLILKKVLNFAGGAAKMFFWS